MIGIYGIFRKSDNKCVYVGESKDIDTRIKYHLSGRSNTPFNSDEYYGEMLEQHFINDKKYRLIRETYWINELNAELNIIRDGSSGMKGKSPWNKGISPSEETINKIRDGQKGKHEGNKNTIGRIWINDGNNDKMIYPDTLQKYMNNGWTLGRISLKNKLPWNKGTTGKKYINNGVIMKCVKPDELQQYLIQGWKFGRMKT